MIIIITGVSGSGKSTIGTLLSKELNIPFYDADNFHPQSNLDKMQAGIPLTDQDRSPWLRLLSEKLKEWGDHGSAVLACSALKEEYRKILASEIEPKWVFLSGTFELIHNRMKQRTHFMKPEMLQSQFQALEIPHYGIHVDIGQHPEEIISEIKWKLLNKSDFGIVGLGVMGRSLAINIANKGISLSVYNRMTPAEKEVIPLFMNDLSNDAVQGFTAMSSFVDSLATPRKILLMVNAGAAVDAVIEQLRPLLSPDDIIIDGGNSHYLDTQRRLKDLAEDRIHFMGAGISGGEQGALKGPSMMIGGLKEQYQSIQSIVEAISAKDKNGKACVALTGPDGCGHLVKTIHNGIEYAEMQLLAECYSLLAITYNNEEISAIFRDWNQGELSSYLLDITTQILIKKDGPDYLLDKVLDKAGSKGTGSWSSQIAFQLGVPSSMINGAVTARYISALKEKRVELSSLINSEISEDPIDVHVLKEAYTFARIINHHQGFEIIKAASQENDWNVNLSEIARIWTAGCIIKSELMESFVKTFTTETDLLSALDQISRLHSMEKSVVDTIKYSFNKRISNICISNSYNCFISITSDRLPANLIQAQRDAFGAHTYERTDQPPNQFFTSNWTPNG